MVLHFLFRGRVCLRWPAGQVIATLLKWSDWLEESAGVDVAGRS